MKIFKSLILLLIFTFCLSSICFGQETVVIANGEWLPYHSEKLPHYGIASHIITEAFALVDVNVKYIFLPLQRGFEDAKKGKIFASMVWSKNKKRAKYFIFSDPVMTGESVFFHLKNVKFDWKNKNDLKKYKIVGVQEYNYHWLDDLEKENQVNMTRVISEKQCFALLLKKRIDVYPSTKLLGYNLVNKHFSKKQANRIIHHPKELWGDAWGLISSKKDPEYKKLIKKFNKGLRILKKSGAYDKMLEDFKKGKYDRK
ncbi:substrate-binding periplasmic protein [Candidatus Margulisiibacteriota bacterium]